MNKTPTILSLCFVFMLATESLMADARKALSEGSKQYENGEYDKARESFNKAGSAAAKEKLDPSVASYNEANTLLRLKLPDDASQKYSDALRSTDIELQNKAYFNKANSLLKSAEADEGQQKLDSVVKKLGEALTLYENAMSLKPDDADSKVNYELTSAKKQLMEQQLKKQNQQQQQQQEQKDQQKEQNDQQHKSQEEKKKEDQRQQEQQQQQQQSDKDSQKKEQQPASAQPSESMTPEEAQMMLDSMKQEEQARRDQLRLFLGQPVPVDKNW